MNDEQEMPQYLIRWEWWPLEHDAEETVVTFEGPFATAREAEAAGEARWPTIDKRHDACWNLRTVYPAGGSTPFRRSSPPSGSGVSS